MTEEKRVTGAIFLYCGGVGPTTPDRDRASGLPPPRKATPCKKLRAQAGTSSSLGWASESDLVVLAGTVSGTGMDEPSMAGCLLSSTLCWSFCGVQSNEYPRCP